MGLVVADRGPLASCRNFVVASLCTAISLPRFPVTVDGIIQPIVVSCTTGQVYRIILSNARWKPLIRMSQKEQRAERMVPYAFQNAVHPGAIISFISV